MSEEVIPTLTHATERDIDLLLVEELFASPTFVEWMMERAGLPNAITKSKVLHSKRRTQSRREIDIFVEAFDGAGKQIALLIENKLDATEQPDQAESYREELDVIADRFAHRAMIVVCPSQYASQHKDFAGKFDAVVSYEQLADYFGNATCNSPSEASRMQFRADLLRQAISKARRGYVPIPNEVIGGFNAKYVALLSEIAPEIHAGPTMLKEAKPNESVSMIFDHKKSLDFLPAPIRPSRFAHELGRGSDTRANYVSVVFRGWGAALPFLTDKLHADAEDLGATFSAKTSTKVRPNTGLVMSCATEPVDNQGSFPEQMPLIVDGIKRALELRSWLLANQDTLMGWNTRVQEVARTQ